MSERVHDAQCEHAQTATGTIRRHTPDDASRPVTPSPTRPGQHQTRAIHLVGSLPDHVSARGYQAALDWQADHLDGIPVTGWPTEPDGEWTLPYLRSLGQRPEFRVIQPGTFTGYHDMQVLRPVGPLSTEACALHREHQHETAHHALLRFAARHHLPRPVPWQVSVPHPLDLALFALAGFPHWQHPVRTVRGVLSALHNLRAFTDAVLADSGQAHWLAGDKTSCRFHVETPSALLAAQWAPDPVRALVLDAHARATAELLHRLPGQAVLHLCYGDFGGVPLTRPSSTAPMVTYLNHLARLLDHRDLPPVHLPFALGSAAPPVTPAFYTPLARLHRHWRSIYAGVVAPAEPAASATALNLVEAELGTVHAVSTACGLGRLDLPHAETAMQVSRDLTRITTNAQPDTAATTRD